MFCFGRGTADGFDFVAQSVNCQEIPIFDAAYGKLSIKKLFGANVEESFSEEIEPLIRHISERDSLK